MEHIDPLTQALRDSKPLARARAALVAVSGGADSTALLWAAKDLAAERGFRVEAGHVDHALRPESFDDHQAVESLCERLCIPFHGIRICVREAAEEGGENLEAAARRLRYRHLAEMARRRKIEMVLTAHTADDVVETILMNLFRGAGARGLSGIPEASERDGVRLVRPFLGIRREEVVAYLERREILWREDPTNLDPGYLRNWIRHLVRPLIEERFPSAGGALLRSASVFERDDDLLDRLATDALRRYGIVPEEGAFAIPMSLLKEVHPALGYRIIRLGLESGGDFVRSLAAVDQVWRKTSEAKTVWSLDLPGGFHVRRQYDALHFDMESPSGRFGPRVVVVEGETAVPEIMGRIRTEIVEMEDRDVLRMTGPMTAVFDADRLSGALMVRSRKPGDRILPLGMEGSRKVKKVLADAKIPKGERNRVPILCDGDEPIWVVGHRMSRLYVVTDETRRVLRVQVSYEG